MAIILIFFRMLGGFVIIAALGASTLIVLAIPSSVTAEPRRLIGGHAVGLLFGVLCYLVFLSGRFGQLITNYEFTFILSGALSVGLSIFLMTITDTGHPPAATTAIGIVANGWSYKVRFLFY